VPGIQDQTGALRRVYVRPPSAADLAGWRSHGWRAEPDPDRISAEHEAFCAVLADAGAEVVIGKTPVPGDPDAIYAYDPVLLTDRGAILLLPGKVGRRDEPEAFARDLETAGIEVAGRLEPPATAEGGDMFWLDARTLVVGRGYRTNDAGIDALRSRSGRGSPSRWTGTRRPAGGWRRRASRSARTRATSSRGRATAARPASRARCSAGSGRGRVED
jgi:hypothetical protein